MNLIKGFDRIALAIAAITLFPGLYLGTQFVNTFVKTESREYQTWQKLYEEPDNELEKEVKGFSGTELYVQTNLDELWKNKTQLKYIKSFYPKQIFAASVFAALQSFFVLILLMVLIRSINLIAKWFIGK